MPLDAFNGFKWKNFVRANNSQDLKYIDNTNSDFK